MTPFPSKKATSFSQRTCAEALTSARLSSGRERLLLFHSAFPFAIQGAPFGLRVAWNEPFRAFDLCDASGFITIVEAEEIPRFIKMESIRQGAVRAYVRGEKLEHLPVPKILSPTEPKKKIRLGSLDLDLNFGE